MTMIAAFHKQISQNPFEKKWWSRRYTHINIPHHQHQQQHNATQREKVLQLFLSLHKINLLSTSNFGLKCSACVCWDFSFVITTKLETNVKTVYLKRDITWWELTQAYWEVLTHHSDIIIVLVCWMKISSGRRLFFFLFHFHSTDGSKLYLIVFMKWMCKWKIAFLHHSSLTWLMFNAHGNRIQAFYKNIIVVYGKNSVLKILCIFPHWSVNYVDQRFLECANLILLKTFLYIRLNDTFKNSLCREKFFFFKHESPGNFIIYEFLKRFTWCVVIQSYFGDKIQFKNKFLSIVHTFSPYPQLKLMG